MPRSSLTWTTTVAAAAVLGFFFLGTTLMRADDAKANAKVSATTLPATISVKLFNDAGELVGPVEVMTFNWPETEWQKQLSQEQCAVLRGEGTERAGSGKLLKNKDEGVYACAACKLPLFISDTKFESGTGWPSFFQPIFKGNVREIEDRSHGMVRTEVECARCGGHLGHVFNDGPKPTGMRYCMNSLSLNFVKKDNLKSLADPAATQPSP